MRKCQSGFISVGEMVAVSVSFIILGVVGLNKLVDSEYSSQYRKLAAMAETFTEAGHLNKATRLSSNKQSGFATANQSCLAAYNALMEKSLPAGYQISGHLQYDQAAGSMGSVGICTLAIARPQQVRSPKQPEQIIVVPANIPVVP